jgi:hypothetical protein
MGAWAEDTFGNDTACDWVGSFLEEPSLEAVSDAIEAVTDVDMDDFLDSDEASECLAACEVLARLQGKWGVCDAYSEDLDNWIKNNPQRVPDKLKKAADKAIARILGPESELVELWDEGGRNKKWHAAVDDLRVRVQG